MAGKAYDLLPSGAQQLHRVESLTMAVYQTEHNSDENEFQVNKTKAT